MISGRQLLLVTRSTDMISTSASRSAGSEGSDYTKSLWRQGYHS